MTSKSTITRERLEKIKSWRETYGAGSNVMLPAEEAEGLASMALAAMDSEPVYQYQSGVYNDDNGETDWYWDDCDKGFYEQYAHDRRRILYRHAQQPVVPDERSAFNAWNNEDNLPIAGVGAKNAAWLAWQARAMLQAGNSPAHSGLRPEQIGVSPAQSHGWIPVSERMPENDVSVLTFDGMFRRVHHAMYGHWQCWEPEKITHWMPLPAAPQEVKGE
ncbi:TPA: DUF551 domain-containing protein [Raoultella planticola]